MRAATGGQVDGWSGAVFEPGWQYVLWGRDPAGAAQPRGTLLPGGWWHGRGEAGKARPEVWQSPSVVSLHATQHCTACNSAIIQSINQSVILLSGLSNQSHYKVHESAIGRKICCSKNVFKWRLKDCNVGAETMCSGGEFQFWAAVTGTATDGGQSNWRHNQPIGSVDLCSAESRSIWYKHW